MKKEFRWQIYFFHVDSKQQHKNGEKNIKLTAIYEKQDKPKKQQQQQKQKTNITLIQILGLWLFLTNGTQNDYIVSYLIFTQFLTNAIQNDFGLKTNKNRVCCVNEE